MSKYNLEELEREFGELRQQDKTVTVLLFLTIFVISIMGYLGVGVYKEVTRVNNKGQIYQTQIDSQFYNSNLQATATNGTSCISGACDQKKSD